MRTAALLAPSLAFACAASAAPVAFDNFAQPPFVWLVRQQFNSPPGCALDPALPAQGQWHAGGSPTPDSFYAYHIPRSGISTSGKSYLESWLITLTFAHVPGPAGYTPNWLPYVPESIPLGGVIDASRDFGVAYLAHLQNAAGDPPPTLYVFTSGGIIGVRIPKEDGVHYAWVRLTYNESAPLPTSRWQPVEWGYETTPNTPIRANTAACTEAGDYTADGVIDFADLNEVLSGFGPVYAFEHLNAVLSNFGTACR